MIINIRGTNGSGKSTVVRRFLHEFPTKERFGSLGSHRPEAYMVDLWHGSNCLINRPLFILGPYQTATGGVDAAGWTVPQLIKMIDKYQHTGHVLFEGVVISTTFGELGRWLVQPASDVVVAFLDTPLEQCLDGVEARGGNREALHIATKHKVIAGVKRKFDEAGVKTEVVSRDNAFEKIKGWLT